MTTLGYYGLTMTASSLSDNLFLNYTLLILVEIPASFFCVYAMDKFGRKPILALAQMLAGVTCIAAGLLSDVSTWLPVSAIMFTMFVISRFLRLRRNTH